MRPLKNKSGALTKIKSIRGFLKHWLISSWKSNHISFKNRPCLKKRLKTAVSHFSTLELLEQVCGTQRDNDAEADVGGVDAWRRRRVDDEDGVLVLAPVGGSLEAFALEGHLLNTTILK